MVKEIDKMLEDLSRTWSARNSRYQYRSQQIACVYIEVCIVWLGKPAKDGVIRERDICKDL